MEPGNSGGILINGSTYPDGLFPANFTDLYVQAHLDLTEIIPLGVILAILSLVTFVGNVMVLHAIRTEKKLQTVSLIL